MSNEVAELKQTVEALHKEVVRLRDQEEVRKLQYKYGYYLDKCLYKETAELFSDDPDTFVQFLGGRYRGRKGVERLYIGRFSESFVGGRNGPVHGYLLDHPQMQGVVDIDYSVSPPRASGRFRSLMQAGVHISQAAKHPRGFTQWWEGGLYENEYIRDGPDGSWRILHLRYFPFWHGDFEHGWGYKVAGFVPFPTKTYSEEDPLAPDEIVEEDQRMMWPDTRVVPFHYDHPITGEPVKDEDMQAPPFGESAESAKPALKLEW